MKEIVIDYQRYRALPVQIRFDDSGFKRHPRKVLYIARERNAIPLLRVAAGD